MPKPGSREKEKPWSRANLTMAQWRETTSCRLSRGRLRKRCFVTLYCSLNIQGSGRWESKCILHRCHVPHNAQSHCLGDLRRAQSFLPIPVTNTPVLQPAGALASPMLLCSAHSTRWRRACLPALQYKFHSLPRWQSGQVLGRSL